MKSIAVNFPSLKSKIIVEAAHVYTYESVSEHHVRGAQLGNMICQLFQNLGGQVEPWLFIDNYNAHFEAREEVLDVPKYLHQIAQNGFIPQKIIYETEMVTQAQVVLESLLKEGFAKKHHTGSIILTKGNVKLYEPSKDRYCCSLLDASLYLLKLSQAPYCVTILPQEYEKQQIATKIILKKLGIETDTIQAIYYGAQTNHTSVSTENVFVEKSELSSTLNSISTTLQLFDIIHKLGGNILPCPAPQEDSQ